MRPEPLTNIVFAVELLNSLSDLRGEQYDFVLKRAYKEIAKAYELFPDNIEIIGLYATIIGVKNELEESIKLFEERVFPIIANETQDFQTLIYRNFAAVLLVNKQYSKSLEIIDKIEPFLAKNVRLNPLSPIAIAFEVYFENGKFEKLIKLIKAAPQILEGLVFKAFYYYYHDDYKKTMETLRLLAKNSIFSKLTKENLDAFFNYLELILTNSSFKKDLTERERTFLEDIKQLAEMFCTYSLKEIYFKEKVTFRDKKYIVNIERTQEGGFYGEIPEIDGCYTEGETVEKLKENILDVLKMYSEEELSIA